MNKDKKVISFPNQKKIYDLDKMPSKDKVLVFGIVKPISENIDKEELELA